LAEKAYSALNPGRGTLRERIDAADDALLTLLAELGIGAYGNDEDNDDKRTYQFLPIGSGPIYNQRTPAPSERKLRGPIVLRIRNQKAQRTATVQRIEKKTGPRWKLRLYVTGTGSASFWSDRNLTYSTADRAKAERGARAYAKLGDEAFYRVWFPEYYRAQGFPGLPWVAGG
jgi:hypothetical protein